MSYDNFAETFSNSRKNHPWPELDYIIEDIQQQCYRSVLDIGCGNGRFLEEADKSCFTPSRYFGIDNSLGMIQEAQSLHPESQFRVIAMENLCTIDGSFDTLLFLASFHHLETRELRLNVLQDAKKFLAPHGRIYMTNWNLLDQPRYEKSYRGNGDFDIKIGEFSRYYHGFTVEELALLFEEAGYKIIENRVFDGGRNILSMIDYSF